MIEQTLIGYCNLFIYLQWNVFIVLTSFRSLSSGIFALCLFCPFLNTVCGACNVAN